MKIAIPDFSSVRVLVVGDVMLDRYWYGDTSRISPEAPVPVVRVKNQEEKPGGAANVALNLSALGADVNLFGLCGEDEAGQILTDALTKAKVKSYFHRLENIPTITKLRVLSLNQQLIRLDFEEKHYNELHEELYQQFVTELPNKHVMILSDYHKGTVNQPQHYIQTSRKAGVPVFVDPKGTDFDRYAGATLLTPNRKEFEAVVGECLKEQQLIEKATNALNIHQLEALLITRGNEGMTLVTRDQKPFYLPALNREVYDVTGAGDTVIAVLAAAVATNADLKTSTMLANLAASVSVSKLGAASVTVHELRRAMHQQLAEQQGIMTEEQLLVAVEDAKAHGEKIVMTNGCFDILHAGHVSYLEEAKSLGDRLIVAVNTDESVKTLKGPTRPLNNLEHRMSVLSALGAVDWVVPFSEDTPERLITHILPDILVKGGDYDPDDIAGGKAVKANGGDVEVLPFLKGCSTTKLVEKIKETV